MTACPMRATGILLLPLLLLCSTSHADTMTLTLDAVSVNTCNSVWTEGLCDMEVVDTTKDDYTPPGNCTFSPEADGI